LLKQATSLLAAVAVAGAVFSPSVSQAFDKFVALGTSSTSGVYYPVGSGICGLVNANRLDHMMRCVAYSTGGSVYNIQALVSGELDVAITRSDLAYQAYTGSGQFTALGANRDLRTITNLYGQPVAVIVKADSGIDSFDQFDGKRINIGNKGSGKRTISDLIFKIMGWGADRFDKVTEFPTGAMGRAFCNGEIDILIESLGIPAAFYDRITSECNGKFLGLPPQLIEGFKRVGPFFYDDRIGSNLYPNNPREVKTVGIKIVLVTLQRLAPRSIEILTDSIFGQSDKFRAIHSALGRSSVGSMLNEGVHVPFHPSAETYYRQKGLLK
jgi:TRAP transporter TAXI family solute receptor